MSWLFGSSSKGGEEEEGWWDSNVEDEEVDGKASSTQRQRRLTHKKGKKKTKVPFSGLPLAGLATLRAWRFPPPPLTRPTFTATTLALVSSSLTRQ